MPKELLIVHDTPDIGLLRDFSGIVYICDLNRPTTNIPDIQKRALILIGQGDAVKNPTDDPPIKLAEVVQEAQKQRIPYLAIGSAMQYAALTLGARLINSEPEKGNTDLEGKEHRIFLNYNGKKDPLFENVPHGFQAFQDHQKTVTTTDNMILLAQSKWCTTQALKLPNSSYGLQFHPQHSFEANNAGPQIFENFIQMNTQTSYK